MPLLSRKRLILAKTETTYGTDITPAGADAILVRNIEVTPLQAEVVSRDLIRPYLGNFEQLLAQTRVEITFEVELAGSGTAGTAPAFDSLLKACGMASTIAVGASVTYAPVSSNFSSATIYFNNDGVRHRITGARGSWSINCQVGQIPVINFNLMGIYNPPTDSAAPTPTYTNQATPLIFKEGNTSGFQFFNYSGCLQSVELDLANEMIYRELVGCTKQVNITNRAPSGTVVIEAPTITQKDYFSIATGTTTGNLTFLHGTTAGNRVTLSSPQTDIGSPTYSDQDGIQMLSLPFVSVPTTAGNDELSLAFT